MDKPSYFSEYVLNKCIHEEALPTLFYATRIFHIRNVYAFAYYVRVYPRIFFTDIMWYVTYFPERADIVSSTCLFANLFRKSSRINDEIESISKLGNFVDSSVRFCHFDFDYVSFFISVFLWNDQDPFPPAIRMTQSMLTIR